MATRKISAMDLVKKWNRQVSPKTDPDRLAWDVLDKMVDGLNDTKLPIDVLRECIRTRDVGGLLGVADSLEPQTYASPAQLLRDRLVVEVFKKYSFCNSPFNKREKAQIRFFEAESMCRDTNKRLVSEPPTGHVNWIIHHAIRAIADLLGAFSPDEMLGGSRFGPGSTLCVTGAFTTQYFKFACRLPSVSSRAFSYAEALLNYDQRWAAYLGGLHPLDVGGRFNFVSDEVAPELRIEDQNKVTFVPKNARTERSIAIEPYFNLYFQLGVGSMIRKRLSKKFGINLDSQKRNQELARQGSVDGRLATIDFSMASDTIARSAVELLLPPEWYNHLDRLRSHEYSLGTGVPTLKYHKFSSMGNGFTFELETLIFAAIARGTHSFLGLPLDEISVFGDDVILSSDAVALFEEVTTYLGFRINAEKSYKEGPFRESCGEDFLEGLRVRPVFCEELDSVRSAVSFSNRLSACNTAVVFDDWDRGWLDGVVRFIREALPRDVRRHLVGPPVEAMDTHIHTSDFADLSASELVRWDPKLFSWRYPTVQFHPRRDKRYNAAVALCMYARLGSRHTEEYSSSLFSSQIISRETIPRGITGMRSRLELVEHTRFEITGRKVGSYRLGTALSDGLLGVPCLSMM